MRKHHSALGGVALALALTLTGCGGDDTEPKVQDTPTPVPLADTHQHADSEDTGGEGGGPADEVPRRARRLRTESATIDFKRLNTVATGDEFLQLQHVVASMIERRTSRSPVEYVHTLAEPRNRRRLRS